MIELYQFPRVMGLPNASSFCMKVECWLRLKGLEYTHIAVSDPGKAPKKKLPYIVHDGNPIADSRFILEYLNETFGPLIEKNELSAFKLAANFATVRMLEDHLYFILVAERWTIQPNAVKIRDEFFAAMPAPMRKIIFPLIQRAMRKQLYQQGTSRHSRDEQIHMGKQAIENLSTLLEDRPFFDGSAPGDTDCAVVALTANCIYPPIDSPLNDFTKQDKKLVDYTHRMMQRVFPEYLDDLDDQA